MTRNMDLFFTAADTALRTLFAKPHATRAMPIPPLIHTDTDASNSYPVPTSLNMAERAHAGALMRVNHVGEVCAQALYSAQALVTGDEKLRAQFVKAAAEETDHLAWTAARLDALGARPSLLNPLWYAGAFGLGLLAGRLGDKASLAFLVETEHQVEAHLDDHMQRLPVADHASRAIVAQMKLDEARHANEAQHAGATVLPVPVQRLMGLASKLMTTVAYRI